jgi:hypothetical protein
VGRKGDRGMSLTSLDTHSKVSDNLAVGGQSDTPGRKPSQEIKQTNLQVLARATRLRQGCAKIHLKASADDFDIRPQMPNSERTALQLYLASNTLRDWTLFYSLSGQQTFLTENPVPRS